MTSPSKRLCGDIDMALSIARQIVLAARPQGKPRLTDFRLEETAVPTPSFGQLLLGVQYLSLDPYMRGRMDDRKSYACWALPLPICRLVPRWSRPHRPLGGSRRRSLEKNAAAAGVARTAENLVAIEAVAPRSASARGVRSREESRMKCLSTLRIGRALVLGFCLGLAACTRAPSEAPAPAPISVMVSYLVERDVTDSADFTARVAAVDSVEVRAHVWGYLEKVHFK